MPRFVDASFVEGALGSGDAVVLNVLSEEQYEESHIPGSLNVPADAPDFNDRVLRLVPDKSTPVTTYCASTTCQASTKAARKLEALGFTDVSDYKAGIQGWTEQGLVTESGPGQVRSTQASKPSGAHAGARPARPRRSRPTDPPEQRNS